MTGVARPLFSVEGVGEEKIKTQPGKLSLAGEGLNIGQEAGR
jgi:hypothetical protein